ncbi:hypothetical protein SEA_HOKKEND_199 [Mycobacterium phage HokkenD]|uniref:Uncharacterized protein n=2 Tax=Omegavirus courthouse TaxID=1089119 RepID=G8I5R4_9CAUD|nr:hypothetical protein CM09_gp215 [Mycobacterium phage Courthouse]YP_009205340.1 hypothetical protein AVT17_gp220 [Mycobacterium phage Ariel]ATS93043.1 hypothetical protein SEA_SUPERPHIKIMAN_205 [Mycobacterium phage Superphikiman]QBJ00151.1 hypothetical protein SEA_PHOEBUS_206 [Mycobacterium phage Phoebus]QDM55783.1 hypothetical protein SEA_HOKKEND_199 [Mycobacterium phage HokkenD]WNM72746.1 hypothetical protein SEA_BOMBITAS_190 [Mycobacterium phage Bombitas]AER48058.1 hypothetical protein C
MRADEVTIGTVIRGELFEVARITTPDWETLAFHDPSGDEIWFSEGAEVDVI